MCICEAGGTNRARERTGTRQPSDRFWQTFNNLPILHQRLLTTTWLTRARRSGRARSRRSTFRPGWRRIRTPSCRLCATSSCWCWVCGEVVWVGRTAAAGAAGCLQAALQAGWAAQVRQSTVAASKQLRGAAMRRPPPPKPVGLCSGRHDLHPPSTAAWGCSAVSDSPDLDGLGVSGSAHAM